MEATLVLEALNRALEHRQIEPDQLPWPPKRILCRARGHASKSEHCLDVVAQLLLACVH